jgi:hypothetical protein
MARLCGRTSLLLIEGFFYWDWPHTFTLQSSLMQGE